MKLRHFVLRELRARMGRAAALGLGLLVAAVGFSLLISETATSVAKVRGTLNANYQPAYDILVRPRGSATALEKKAGLVRDSYLSDLYGGITMKQWQRILHMRGVSVAAPIENVGYILLGTTENISLARFIRHGAPTQLYRLSPAGIVHGGLSRYPQPRMYFYYTTDEWLHPPPSSKVGTPAVRVPGVARPLNSCQPAVYGFGSGIQGPPPFDLKQQEAMYCAGPNQNLHVHGQAYDLDPPGHYDFQVEPDIPTLISAIDPAQEDKLVHLAGATVSGRPLRESDALGPPVVIYRQIAKVREMPIVASSRTFLDEDLQVKVQRLNVPSGKALAERLATGKAGSYLDHLAGTTVGAPTVRAKGEYQLSLAQLRKKTLAGTGNYWTTRPVGYKIVGHDRVRALTVNNPETVWEPNGTAELQVNYAPAGSNDTQYRLLSSHSVSGIILGGASNPHPGAEGVSAAPAMRLVGTFDPARLPHFAPLSKVPLQTFYPPTVTGADPASRKALGNRALGPTTNIAGYIGQPPLVLTTIKAASRLFDPSIYGGASPRAPISVIQVKVTGVTGANASSEARVRRVADHIGRSTGLRVDITAGSSPAPVQVDLAKGRFGQPPLQVVEGWTKKGVATVITRAIDRKALALFVLVLVVCGLFVANASMATVRARRGEIATLATLGWGRRHIFGAVLGEVTLIGLVAGVAGALIALGLVEAFSLSLPLLRVALVVPAAVVVAGVAGALPAWGAARIAPLEALAPPVARSRVHRRVRSIPAMGWANLARVPGRSLLAALALLIGVATFTFLLGIEEAFHGHVVGNLLGNAIAFQVKGADYVSVALILLLGAGSVADVLIINLRERAPELAVLRAIGWSEGQLARTVSLEGLGIGFFGALIGAALGLLGVAFLGAPVIHVLLPALAAFAAGILACLVALLPALRWLTRLDPAAALAAE